MFFFFFFNTLSFFQFPSLHTTNNPLATTIKAILTDNADYLAYTSDLKTVTKNADSNPDKNVRLTSLFCK
jgi:hypothetical protein